MEAVNFGDLQPMPHIIPILLQQGLEAGMVAEGRAGTWRCQLRRPFRLAVPPVSRKGFLDHLRLGGWQ